MRKACILAAAAILAGITACSPISDKTREMVDKPAPYTRVTMLDGTYVPLSSFRGRTVVLAFWGTWCSRSKGVLRDLSDYAKSHRRPDVEYIAVSIDRTDNFETLNNMINHQGLNNLQHAFSGNDVRDEAFLAFGLISVPTIIVIGPDGAVKGVGTDMDVVEEQLQRR